MTNILFFIDKFAYNGSIGGAEKVLLNLVNYMDKSEFNITVQTVFYEAMADRLDKSVRYCYCYRTKNAFTRLIYRIETQLGLTYLLHIKDKYDIEAAFLESEPTKVIASSTNRKAKKLAWVHCDLDVSVKDKENFVRKTSKWYSKYDKVICVSEKCKDSFEKLFGNSPESIVIHNVIDEDEILKKSQVKLSQMPSKTQITLLCVGRLTPQKNPMRLLATHRRLLDAGINHELWMVGDGEIRVQVEDEIKRLNISNTVKLLGFQNNPYPFMNRADLLVCSSNYEGYSTVVTEGLILGKPIVTTNCSGMKELLGNSEYGIVTENTDEAFYNGLYDVLMDREKLQMLRDKAKQRGKEFGRSKLLHDTECFFKDMLGEKQG